MHVVQKKGFAKTCKLQLIHTHVVAQLTKWTSEKAWGLRLAVWGMGESTLVSWQHQEKGSSWLGTYWHAYAEGGRQSFRLTGSIVGGLWWICMCCHGDFTQLNLYSSLCDGAEWEKKRERGGLMRWNTCKCLLFEEQQSLGNPLSSLSAHCLCVYECARPCRALRNWKPEGVLSSILLNLKMQQL